MNAIEHTTGNAYTFDEDYAALSGRVVLTTSVVQYDPKLKVFIKRTYEYIDIGRSDSVAARDPKMQLASEQLPSATNSLPEAFRASIAANAEQRHLELKNRLVSYLQEHGPTRGIELLPISGYKNGAYLYDHLAMFPETYMRYCERPLVWGLFGQTYIPPERQPTKSAMRIREILITNGPMLVSEIANVLEVTNRFVDQVIHQHTENVFIKTGMRKRAGVLRPLWGVVGIHPEMEVS